MPIDPRIPLSVFGNQPDVMESYSRAQALQNLMDQRKMNALQAQEAQMRLKALTQQQAEQDAVRQAAAGAMVPQSATVNTPAISVGGMQIGGGTQQTVQGPARMDNAKFLSNLSADPNTAYMVPAEQQKMAAQGLAQQKALLEFRETLGKISKQDLDNAASRLELTGRYFNAVESAPPEMKPQVYATSRAHAIQSGLVSENDVPAQYDPAWMQQQMAQSMTVKEAIVAEQQRRTAEESKRHNQATELQASNALGETKRHNRVSEGLSAQANARAAEMNSLKAAEMGNTLTQQSIARQGAAASYQTALDTLDTLEKHPGLSASVGLKNPLVGNFGVYQVPGTDSADFNAYLDTFKAQTFLPMVQSLRGMGALSDAEGRKLTDAVGALSTKMSEKSFKESLNNIRGTLKAAQSRVQSGAVQRPVQQPASGGIAPMYATNPQTKQRIVSMDGGQTWQVAPQ